MIRHDELDTTTGETREYDDFFVVFSPRVFAFSTSSCRIIARYLSYFRSRLVVLSYFLSRLFARDYDIPKVAAKSHHKDQQGRA